MGRLIDEWRVREGKPLVGEVEPPKDHVEIKPEVLPERNTKPLWVRIKEWVSEYKTSSN